MDAAPIQAQGGLIVALKEEKMKKNTVTLFIGLLLVVGGILFMLQNFNVLSFNWSGFIGLAFAAGGLIFLAVFIGDSQQWWALIPGLTLLGLSALILLPIFVPFYPEAIGGGMFLGMIALAFWLIFAIRRDFWWAIIPAGTLTTLAVVAGMAVFPIVDQYSGGIFFLGLALTFGLLAILPVKDTNLHWAVWPAVALAVLGVLVMAFTAPALNFIWPIALIVAGLAVLAAALRPRPQA
jgi:hypothetical protein